MLEQLVLLLLY